MRPSPQVYLDEFGQPLSARLQDALAALVPCVRRDFPALHDDCMVTEVLEESGRRIAAREERKGPLDNLPSYTWVVVRRLAALRLRHDKWATAAVKHNAQDNDAALADLESGFATSEQIEARILVNELFAQLTPTERDLLKAKHRGLSTDETARIQGTSPLAVFNAWRRLKRKVFGLTQGRKPLPSRLNLKKASTF